MSRTTLLMLLPVLAGCALPGAIAYKIFGPEAIPARYTPPKEPMLVLVEESSPNSGAIVQTEDLAVAIHEELKAHDVAPLIDPREVQYLKDNSPALYRQMGISEIGRKLGAKQILYVAVRHFDMDVPQAADVMKARLSLDFKVVDAQSAEVRWPDSGDGEPYEYETDYSRISPQNTPTAVRGVAIRKAAGDIGRTFYKWKPETMQEENQQR